MTWFTGGGAMEPGLGYHYPAGTPAPSTEHDVPLSCENGHHFTGKIHRDLGHVDIEPETCPTCGDYRIKRSDRS